MTIGLLVLSSFVSAEVLVMNLNNAGFTAGESARVFGYVLDDSLGGVNDTAYSVYLDGSLQTSNTTDTEGFYEHYITNLETGSHTVNVNTSESNQTLTFNVLAATAKPSYQIIASSLVTAYRNPTLTFTVKKFLGNTLTSNNYTYQIFYENGTLYDTSSGVSNIAKVITLPQKVGLYKILVDQKKSFTASVAKFTMKTKISDVAGNYKDTFKPNGIAYFEVEGFSNGQKITNATVTAKIKDSTGTTKTVTFTESNGIYKGNTNVTQTTAIQLRSGNYEVEFKMKDSSNNEQIMKGFFKVVGLNVEVKLIDKRPYQEGEDAEFDVIVKNLENGNLIEHSDVAYTFELEQDGKIYTAQGITAIESTDPTLTSEITYEIPEEIEDGNYFLRVKATSSGKTGKGAEYFEVMNTQIFVDLQDNFGGYRDLFQPGELAKIAIQSDTNLDSLIVTIVDKTGVTKSTNSKAMNNATSGYVSFNVPQTQAEYIAKIEIVTAEGQEIFMDRWFRVQNYFSFLDVKDIETQQFKFIMTADEEFLGEINVFDIAKGQAVDLSNFVVKFDKIIGEETQKEYTNLQATKNNTLSDAENGRLTYKITPPTLPNGFYRIEYTLVDSNGKSFKGKGWFGISAFDVDIKTYDSSGQRKELFSSGQSINVTVTLSDNYNGTARLHREFFPETVFNIDNGVGSVVLSSSAADQSRQIPSQSGFYGFGVEVENEAGDKGLGDWFFEIRNLNFRTINVRNNGKFSPGDNILVDVVMEKSGSLVNDTNITLNRLFRARDGAAISATGVAQLTSSIGATTLNITPTTTLEPGDYFADVKAEKGNDVIFNGFGFRVLEDKVLVTINDADKKFSQTENVEINIKVTDQNDNVKSGVIVNLTGLLNFNTWAPVTANKQATTGSNGVATITISAANFNPARYAPILEIQDMTETFVGFGDGEFEIKPFDTTINFASGEETYTTSDETIAINVLVTGDVTVTATVTNMISTVQEIDYYYSSGVLTLNNDLDQGEYFIEVAITQSSSTVRKKLWFEVIAPWLYIEPLQNPNYAPNDVIDVDYTVFTMGATNGWQEASATINITTIENMWSGDIINVSENFSGTGQGIYQLSLAGIDEGSNLPIGDYFLNFELVDNSNEQNSLYFRVDDNVWIMVNPKTESGNNYVTLNFSTSLSESANYYLEEYQNFKTGFYTQGSSQTIQATGQNVEFDITGLENGFYQAKIRIEDGSSTYYWDAWFDIRVRDVTINTPEEASVGEQVQFNITGVNSATTFWIIDPFTQTALKTQALTPGPNYTITYTFNYPGFFVYSYGATKWDAFPNGEDIEINQAGFEVEWPWNNNRYILTGSENFTFNVTADTGNLQLTLKNHFNNQKTIVDLGLTTGELQIFTFDLDEYLNLTNGPHDVELVLNDGSTQPPRESFFIDIFPDQYDMWAWTNMWEYRAGETVAINIEIYNITQNWLRVPPTSVTLHKLLDPFWSPVLSPEFAANGNKANISTNGFYTGNYHAELNVTIGGASRIIPIDFFVRGNDNLELFWNQPRWDYSSDEQYTLTITAKDKGTAVSGVSASLASLEKRAEDWNSTPVAINVTSEYLFSNSAQTNNEGKVTFTLNLSSLANGGYTGRINVGGQIVWFDFQVRSYMVDAYTEQWEYGITDTIELNIRARNMDTWAPINEDGNITIEKIYMHEPGQWEPEEVPLASFGITNAIFDVVEGETLIEMQGNQTALNLSQPYEFELKMTMDLENKGETEAWTWFRLSNEERPQISIVDRTGNEPEAFFGGQTYSLQLTNVNGATLRNMWGPCGQMYNQPLINYSDTWKLNFTTPNCPGWYDLEVEVVREGGFTEYMYENFQIGGGTEMNLWGEPTIVPGINFTVYLGLFGEGEDPWCKEENGCYPNGNWYGPLANKTVTLKGIKDLEGFTYTDLSAQNISRITTNFPSWMIGSSTQEMIDCSQIDNSDSCNAENSCIWDEQTNSCMNMEGFCAPLNEADCISNNPICLYDNGNCFFDQMSNDGPMGDDMMMEEGEQPGDAIFNLNPSSLGMIAGKKYDLIFSYVDDNEEETTEKYFVQVEKFHVAISKNEENLGAKTEQPVWIGTMELDGTPLAGCDIVFDAIYNEKDYQLVKPLSVNSQTDENGTLVFTYTTPSLPGYYLVKGDATCNLSGTSETQDIAYFIEVGAKSFEVDMKTKFKEGENIKVSITTKDRLGLPTSQRMEVNLFHDKDDYPFPVYSLGGTDCTTLDANQDWDYFSDGSGSMVNNRIEVETDATGKLELELCPMPNGIYMLDIFPMFDFEMMDEGPMTGPKDDDKMGFFTDFVVSSADITVTVPNYVYQVGELVMMYVSVLDEDGNLMTGTITDGDIFMKDFASGKELILWEVNESINIVNGVATFNYTIPTVAPNDMNESEILNVTLGTAGLFLLIQDESGNNHIYDNMIHAIKKYSDSELTIPSSVKTNKLIDVSVITNNLSRYKAQAGVFFLKDNTEKEKMWYIEGGVFFHDLGDGTSGGNFKILSPKEPGNYYMGLLLYELGVSAMGERGASELLIAPIEVTLDLVNITGIIVNKTGTAIEGAMVKIGKVEKYTAADGTFSMSIPKGKMVVEVEKKTGTLRQFMKTISYNFDANKEINITLYPTRLSGTLANTFFNISRSTNLETQTKLSITVNTSNEWIENLTNVSIEAVAPSGKTKKYRNISSSNSILVTFNQLYAGFKDSTNELVITLKATPKKWNSTNYVLIDGVGVNSTVGAILKKTYTVETYAGEGDGIDNDGDCANFPGGGFWCDTSQEWINTCTDEEKNNNKDDDCDGKIDEDLEAPFGGEVFRYCGDGLCDLGEESCYIDCGGQDVTICGNTVCEPGEETWCSDDCEINTCNTPWTCQGEWDTGMWCNQQGILTAEGFCDFCSWVNPEACGASCNSQNCWACSTDGTNGSTNCEIAGCDLGSDDYGTWCYWEPSCSANDCWACHNVTACTTGTGDACQWEPDSWSPEGGWCNRPWTCESECGACITDIDCSSSEATMIDMMANKTVSCAWIVDRCEFNWSTDEQAIMNFWISTTPNVTSAQSADADFNGFSGSNGWSGLSAGCYFITVKLGNTDVGVYLDSNYLETFTGDYEVLPYQTSSCQTLANGTWEIYIDDLLGLNDFWWTINIGSEEGEDLICGELDLQGCLANSEECSWVYSGSTCVDQYCYAYDGNFASCNSTNGCEWDAGRSECNPTGTSICGNGYLESGEQCDDSNTDNDDGCNSGCQVESEPEESNILTILSPVESANLDSSTVSVSYNVTAAPANYQKTKIILNALSVERVDALPGEFSYEFTEVNANGAHNLIIELVNSTNNDSIVSNNVTFATQWGYITCTGSTPANAIMYMDGLPRQNCISVNPYGIEIGNHTFEIRADGYESYFGNFTITTGQQINYTENLVLIQGGDNESSMFAELNLTNTQITSNETHIDFKMYVENLSNTPMCEAPNLMPGEFERWQVAFDTDGLENGCDFNFECNGTEDFKLNVEMTWNGTQFPEFAVWNGTDFETDGSADMYYEKNCDENSILLRTTLSEIGMEEGGEISTIFASEYQNGNSSTIVRTINAGYTVGGQPEESSNVTLSGYLVYPDGSVVPNEGIEHFNLHVHTDLGNDYIYYIFDSNYFEISLIPRTYDALFAEIQLIGADEEDNSIQINNYSLSENTELNFTAMYDSELTIDIITSDDEYLTLGEEENYYLNITIGPAGQFTYINYSVDVGVYTANKYEPMEFIIGNFLQNISISPGESLLLGPILTHIVNQTYMTNVSVDAGLYKFDYGFAFDNKTGSILAWHFKDETESRTVLGGNETPNNQSGLEGNITGSIIPNVTIDIFNASNDEFITSIQTDENSEFAVDLAPGMYNIQTNMPPDYAFPYMIVDVENVNITTRETMYISVPHINGIPLANNVPITGLLELENGTPVNISMFVNNTDNFGINVTFQINASETGDTALYDGEMAYITGGSFNTLSYQIVPNILGLHMNGLVINLELEIDANEVLQGSIASGSMLRVAIDDVRIPVNVTGGI